MQTKLEDKKAQGVQKKKKKRKEKEKGNKDNNKKQFSTFITPT